MQKPAESSVATDVVNGFGVDLYNALIATEGRSLASAGNIVVSPTSIALALAMTRAGAREATSVELDAVLHVRDGERLDGSMHALRLELDEVGQSIVGTDDEPIDIELVVVNALWGQCGFAFEPSFTDVVASGYGAEVRLVDFESSPETVRLAINEWVAGSTGGRIDELLAQGSIDAETRLTLVNAILMKAPWAKPFDDFVSKTLPFTTALGSIVSTRMMRKTDRIAYRRGPDWQAVELPYAGGLMSMIVVLPDPAATRPASATSEMFTWNSASEMVALSLPVFDVETRLALADVLSAMGMPTIFDADLADLSAMAVPDPADPEPLFISAVAHQARITVDETGTEAAAATAVMLAAGSAAPSAPPIQFTVDRPFLFAIRHNPSGAMLFLGCVADPTASD